MTNQSRSALDPPEDLSKSDASTMDQRQSDYRELLVKQYCLAVEMADRVSARRAQANSVYISLLTGILIVPAVTLQDRVLDADPAIPVIAGVFGVFVSAAWIVTIDSYRQLNSVKFAVIHDMEDHLPEAYFVDEWRILRDRRHRRTTEAERLIPIGMLIPYLALILLGAYRW